jgi:ribosome-binding ATPase YchF (GTP1/OBG family)
MILGDLELVEKRLDRLKKEKGKPREDALLAKLKAALDDGKAVRALDFSEDDWAVFSGFRFLTQKPLLLVLNVDEAKLAEPPPAEIAAYAKERGLGLVVLSAKVEQDIAQMPPAEQKEFLAALGVTEPAKDRFIRGAFALLDLISFLTAGEDECRAWPIKRGTKAQRAAGKVHSDIERGFIRAETVRWEDLVELKSEARCREAGKLRLEGKEYIVQDGDVINYRFNV